MDSTLSGIAYASVIAAVASSSAFGNSSLSSSTQNFMCSNSYVKPSILYWLSARNILTDSLAAYMTLSMAVFA
jgi:hypothetical protein